MGGDGQRGVATVTHVDRYHSTTSTRATHVKLPPRAQRPPQSCPTPPKNLVNVQSSLHTHHLPGRRCCGVVVVLLPDGEGLMGEGLGTVTQLLLCSVAPQPSEMFSAQLVGAGPCRHMGTSPDRSHTVSDDE